jgi:polysaccharide biosynthesis transport protein
MSDEVLEQHENEHEHHPRRHRHHAKSQLLRKLDHYKILLLEKWWIIVIGLVLGTGVGAALSIFGPPSFSSIGRMIVSIKLSIPEGSVYSEEMSAFLGTQTALMQSGTVLNRAQARVLAQTSNATPHHVSLKVNVLPKTSIFVLQATGEDPEYTSAFLQACMEEYTTVKREMRTQTSDSTVAGLTEEVLRLEKELRKSDSELVDFQNTNNVIMFEEQRNSTANYLTVLNQKLAEMKSEYELLQMLTLDQDLERRQALNNTATPAATPVNNTTPVPAPAPANPPDNSGQNNSALTGGDNLASQYFAAKQQLLLMKAEQQDLGQYLRPKHPKMVAMAEEISRRERLLDIFRKQGSEQLENRKATLAMQIENLERDVKESTGTALEMNRKTAEYQRLKENAARTRALYDRLLSTMQTLDVNKEISQESVTIMEKASPAFPDRPKLSKQLMTGALVGLALSMGLMMLLDRLDDRMSSLGDLQEFFDEEVLGQIPRERSQGRKKEPALVATEDARHAFVEAYRNLRSWLIYKAESGERCKTILITSSVPNDGKSMTAANFAITLAHSGSRVLLVDADLRKGTLHHRMGIEAQPGLCEILTSGQDWRTAVRPTTTPNLFLLPRGQSTHNSSELFIRDQVVQVMKEMSEAYDYVVVDTAPVMAADDVTSLAPHMDGVLFVVRAEQTSARVARAALDLLYQRQVNVLGIVFNAVRPSSSDYYYYYKYEDYYRSYPEHKEKPVNA